MNGKTLVIAAIALSAVLVPTATASTASTTDDGRLECSGQPTGDPRIDGLWQLTCALVGFACDFVFRPCPITARDL